jgi:DNA-3-methyladenine glycosylase II
MTDAEVKKAIAHLKKRDKKLAVVIERVPPFAWTTTTGNYFFDLVDSIISQQLSIKAAGTILKRFVALFPDGKVTPQAVLEMDAKTIREAGISFGKISYIKDLATKTEASGILFEQFEIMTDEEIIEELVKVKGIGRWTAEMFLMFTMGRPDVFSYGDLGLRNAIRKLYGFEEEPTRDEAGEIAEKWKPYRTLACRYLWKSLEL